MKSTVEKPTQLILGILGLVVLAIYVINGFKLGDWGAHIYTVTGFALVLILLAEGGVLVYFKEKGYRKIDWKDFVVWLTMGLALVVLVTTVIGIRFVANQLPQTVLDFYGKWSAYVGLISGIAVVIQMITPTVKG